MMQLVNRTCDICRKHIAFQVDATGCHPCDAAYHKTCLPDPELCPRCGENFGATTRARRLAERKQQGREIRIR